MSGKDRKPKRSVAYWVALACTDGLGARTFAQLRALDIERDLPIPAADLLSMGLDVPPRVLQGLASMKIEEGEKWMEKSHFHGQSIIDWDSSLYPHFLAQSTHALPAIFTHGALPSPPSTIAVSMVGTRTPGPWARSFCNSLIGQLDKSHAIIVSGLAQGIDSYCHQAALDQGLPTIAVLAQGLEMPIGGSRELLAGAIVDSGGCLLSPFPPGTVAKPGRFIQRNRIIAGLGHATLLVESGENGGAMHTARFCLETGRPLYAIPGDPWRESAQGGNSMLRAGLAQAIWQPEDLAIALHMKTSHQENTKTNKIPPEWQRYSGKSIALPELQLLSGKTYAELLAILTHLEINNHCQVLNGQWVHFR